MTRRRRAPRRRLPLRSQVELADCGPACLAIVLASWGRFVAMPELRAVCRTGDGTTALDLVRGAESQGLVAKGLRTELADLRSLPRASVLFWQMQHFVVLERTGRAGVTIVDPAGGRRVVSWEQADRDYSGTAIVFEPGPAFVPQRRGLGVAAGHLVRPILAARGALGRVVSASLLLRALGLSLPLLTAAIIDRVLPTGGRGLLAPLAAAMAVLVLLSGVGTWLRSRVLLSLRLDVDRSTTLAFLDHLVALPLTFHQRRESGDLVLRLRSSSLIRETLTATALSTVLDGSFAALYLVLLLRLSPMIAVVALGVGAVEVAVVVGSQRVVARQASETLAVEARSQSYAYQLLGGLPTLKSSGTEARAVEEFARRFSDELAVADRRGRTQALLDAANAIVAGAGPLLLLGAAALAVLDGRLRLGAALSADALAAGFLAPVTALVGTAGALVVVRSYLDRLEDVFEARREQEGVAVVAAPVLAGHVRAEGLRFRYAPAGPDVVDGVDVEVTAGQVLALVGPSGSGKTTLAQLLVGLHEPAGGRVLHDGLDLAGLALPTIRRQLGVVTQEPYLFAMSLRENIAFGAPDATLDDVRAAAAQACIADVIDAMPLGYDTVVAEGGGSLSGGQRQRVALARALCSRPRLLLLDEATSHLDVATEQAVQRSLDALGCTRIIVAHRLSTIVRADCVVVLEAGRVVEAGPPGELAARGGPFAAMVVAQGGSLDAVVTAAPTSASPATRDRTRRGAPEDRRTSDGRRTPLRARR